MTESKLQEETKTSPYDLWPDESAPFAATADVPPLALPEASPFGDPFAEPTEEVSKNRFEAPFEAPFIPVAYTPDTTEQTIRKSGLAWSAGVVFFGSVAFMLLLGWFADLLLGSSPYGIVIGIVLGSIIGFVQFFRISSQIYSPQKGDPDHRPLLSRDDDE